MFKFKKSIKRIKEAGVVKFYHNRKVLSEDVGSIGDFIKSAQQEVVYVGCWLSSSLKQDFISRLVERANEGVVFKICLHSPRAGAIHEYASFFNLDDVSVITQIEDSIIALHKAKSHLDPQCRDNIRLYWHSEMITTSFWLIDSELPSAKMQLDFKLVHSVSRWFSFGMEIVKSKSNLFQDAKQSYLSVIDENRIINEEYIEDITGIRAKKDELKREITERYPFNCQKPYVFISYSHKNELTVLHELLKLKAKVNCWVDFENLDGGRNMEENDWTKKIRPVLEHENCRGVISYVSEEGFASSGFIKECDWIKVNRPEFYCFLIGFTPDINATRMLEKIRGFTKAGESEREKQIRDEALSYLTQATVAGKESYYRVSEDGRHLIATDFLNWLKKIKL